jgi:hypothetical protein
MKERPILFSAPMVNAILEGRKTQTRRAMKIQPPSPAYQLGTCVSTTGKKKDVGRHHWIHLAENGYQIIDGKQPYFSRPYGNAGDRLWVRETWALTGRMANAKLSDFLDSEFVLKQHLIHRADADGYDETVQGWRPSIFMPRWASRILLEITGVRVERLQDISEQDAISEGGQWTDNGPRGWLKPGTAFDDGDKINGWKEGWSHIGETDPDKCMGSARMSYANLWESINGAGSWDANPWVWVLEFKRVEK